MNISYFTELKQNGATQCCCNKSYFCVFTRWDNGETEKLSPWDVEAIPDDGN